MSMFDDFASGAFGLTNPNDPFGDPGILYSDPDGGSSGPYYDPWQSPPIMPTKPSQTYQPFVYTLPPAAAPATQGHSTRDAILDTINNSVAAIFGNKNQSQALTTINPTAAQVAAAQAQNQSLGSQASGTVNSFLEGVANTFGVSQTTLMIGGALAVYLLFKPPPRRR